MQSPWLAFVFCAYFAILIGMASVRSRRMRDMEDYVLGGRRLSSLTAALSAGASATSAWTILSLPALAFTNGAVAMWIPASSAVGIWLSWVVLAKRLRRYTIEVNALTIPEFLEARFGDTSGTLRALASVITVLFVTFYVSSGFVAGSKLLETVFGIEASAGVLLTSVGINVLHPHRGIHGGIEDGCIPGAVDARGPDGDLVTYAWGGMGAAFGPVTILALCWRRFNYCGAVASMVAGTLGASVWWYLDGGPAGMWDIHPATPGFLLSMSVAVVVASMTAKPSDEVVAFFDPVNRVGREE